MSAERTVAKNAVWLSLQPLFMNVLSLASTGYIARQLGSSEFGRFNLAYTFVAMFAPLASMGLRALAVRHVAQNRDCAADYLGRQMVLRGMLAVVCAVLVIAAAPLSGGSAGARAVIAIAAVGMIFTTLGSVFVDGYQAFERMRPVILANMVGALLLTISSVAVIWSGGGIREMALAYVLGPLCTLLLLWLWARQEPFCPQASWDLPAFASLLRQGAPFFGIAILDVISLRLDVLVLAQVMGDANLGSYTAAASLVDRAMVICDGAAMALLPAIAHLSAQSAAAAVPLLRKSGLWLLLVTLPIALVTTVLSPLIVKVIFGDQYAAAGPILAVAIWRLPATCLAMLEGHSLLAIQRQSLVLRTGGLAMALSIAFIYPLVWFLGPLGGAIALVIRPILTFLFRAPMMVRSFPGLWAWGQLSCLGIALCLMGIPLAFVPYLDPGINLVLLVLASGSIYLVSLGLMRVVPLGELVGEIRRRLDRSSAPPDQVLTESPVDRKESVTVATGLTQARRDGKPRVLLFGGDGGDRNLGDQAMLINTVARIRRFLPAASITVMAGKPERLPELVDVRRVRWPEDTTGASKERNGSLRIPGLWRLWRIPALIRGACLVWAARRLRHTGILPADRSDGAAELLALIQDTDLVVNYGSGGLNDIWARSVVYPWSFCYLAAHALGKRVIVTGQGIGPLSHPLDRRLLCTALDRVDAVTVRDCHDSMELLRRGRVRTTLLRIAADDALSLDPAPQVIARKALEEEGVPASRPLVALQFRDTAFDRAVGQQDRTLMAAIADRLVEETGAHIVFVSTVYNEMHGVDDRAAAESVVSQMRHAGQVTVLRGVYDPPTVKSLIAEADLAIGTSYHFQIFALATHRPTIGLYKGRYYRQKAHGLFGHFGRTDSIFDLESCSAEEVVRQALTAMKDREQLAKSADVVIRDLNEALDETWSHVAGWFAADDAMRQVAADAASEPTLMAR